MEKKLKEEQALDLFHLKLKSPQPMFATKRIQTWSSLEIVFKSTFTKQKLKEKLKKIDKSKIKMKRNLNQSLTSTS